ncbi:MAG: hypothetical protein NVSMB3_03460 [Acidobacteriaceae bacterium]
MRSDFGAPGAVPGGTISRRTTGSPAFAMWAAMREPIVPAPRTATLRISRGCDVAGAEAEAVGEGMVVLRDISANSVARRSEGRRGAAGT